MERGIIPVSLSRLLQFCDLYNIHPGQVLDGFYGRRDDITNDEQLLAPSRERKELLSLISGCPDNRIHDILTIASALINDDAK